MQFGGGGTPPVGVLFDGAFDRIGDLLALAVLYGLQSKSEARVASISVNRPDLTAAQFCDALKSYYSGGGFGGFGGGGLARRRGGRYAAAAAGLRQAARQKGRGWRAASTSQH